MNTNSAAVLHTLGLAVVGATLQFAISVSAWKWGWQATTFSTGLVFGAFLILAPRPAR